MKHTKQFLEALNQATKNALAMFPNAIIAFADFYARWYGLFFLVMCLCSLSCILIGVFAR